MLHIRRRSEPTARWAARGWPPLLRWTDRPEVPWLFWALHEVAGAAQAEDFDAVDDLLTEAGLMLERVWTDPPAGARQSDVMSISTGLWAEVQRGRGVSDLTQVALHARLLRNLVAPTAGQLPARPALAVHAYRPPGDRIEGSHLPLAGAGAGGGRELQEQFLLLIATVLSNGGGHLVDHANSQVPRGADPVRTGWTRPGAPTGSRLALRAGSIPFALGRLPAGPASSRARRGALRRWTEPWRSTGGTAPAVRGHHRRRRRPVTGVHLRCAHRVAGRRVQPGPAWPVVARRPARPGCAGVWRGVRPGSGRSLLSPVGPLPTTRC